MSRLYRFPPFCSILWRHFPVVLGSTQEKGVLCEPLVVLSHEYLSLSDGAVFMVGGYLRNLLSLFGN